MKKLYGYLLLLVFFLALPSSIWANEEELNRIYLRAYNLFQQASAEMRTGNLGEAQEQYQSVLSLLLQLRQMNPSWQKNIVDYLQEECDQMLSDIAPLAKNEFRVGVPSTQRQPIAKALKDDRVNKLNILLQQKERKINSLLTQVQQTHQLHRSQLAELQNQKMGLKRQIDELQYNFDGLKRTNMAMITENEILQDKLIKQEKRLKSKANVEQNLTRLNRKQKDLLEDQEVLSQLIEEKEKTIENLEQSYTQLTGINEGKINLLGAENETLRSRVEQLQFKLEKEQTANQLKRKTAEEQLKAIRFKLAQAERDLTQVKLALLKEQGLIEKKEGDLKNKLTALVNERDMLREKIALFSVTLTQKEAQNASMQTELSEVKEKLGVFQNKFEKKSLSLDSLLKDKEKLLAEKDKIKKQYSQLQIDYNAQRKNFDSQINENGSLLSQLKEDKQKLERNFRQSDGEVISLKQQTQNLKIKNEKLQNNLAAINEVNDSKIRDMKKVLEENKQETIAQLTTQFGKQLLEKTQDKQVLQTQIQDFEIKLEEMKKEYGRLGKKLKATQAQVEKSNEENVQANHRIQELLAENTKKQDAMTLMTNEFRNQLQIEVKAGQSYEMQIENYKKKLAALKEDKAQSETQLKQSSEMRIQNIKAELALALEEKTQKQETIAGLRDDLGKANEEKIQMSRQLEELNTAKVNKETEINRLKNEINQFVLKDERANQIFEDRAKDFDVQSVGLKKQIVQLEENVEQLLAENKQKDDEMTKIKDGFKNVILQKEKTAFQTKRDFERKLAQKEKEKSASEQQVLAIKQHYDGIIQELNNKVDEVVSFVEQKVELEQAKQQIQEDAATESLTSKVEDLNNLLLQYKQKYQATLVQAEKRRIENEKKLKETIQYLKKSTQPEISKVQVSATQPERKISKLEKAELIKKVSEMKEQEKKLFQEQKYNRNSIMHYNQGVDFADKGKIAQAKKEFQEAIKLMPNFFEAHYNLGRTYVMEGEKEKAIQAYLKSLAIREDPDVYYGLGAIYWQMGEWEKVIQNWKDVLRLNPDHTLARQWLEKAKQKAQQAGISSTP